MSKVDFVIIAFPKCGTTSLVDNLNKHSKINVYHNTGSKESVLFHTKAFNNPIERKKHDELLVEGKMNGEKNPTYIWNMFALNNIKKYNPDMKVIISLRNPVNYLYSWYHQLFINNGKCKCSKCCEKRGEEVDPKLKEEEDAKLKEIEEHAEKIRKENEELQKMYAAYATESDNDMIYSDNEEEPEKKEQEEGDKKEEECKIPTFKDFYEKEHNEEQSYFVNYVIRALDIFGKENTHIMVQEEYEKDNQTELNKIFTFLGLEEQPLEGLTRYKGKRPNGDMDEETRLHLLNKYKEHNENLFEIIGRKIDIWD